MKFLKIQPGPEPKQLTAKPKVRKLGEHEAGFLNANNPKGFIDEETVQEATTPAVLSIWSSAKQIGEVLLRAITQPFAADALSTGLPKHLREYFQQVEAAVEEQFALRQQRETEADEAAKTAIKKAAKRAARKHYKEVILPQKLEERALQNALNPHRHRYDPLREVRENILQAKFAKLLAAQMANLSPREELELLIDRALALPAGGLFPRHNFGTRRHFSFRSSLRQDQEIEINLDGFVTTPKADSVGRSYLNAMLGSRTAAAALMMAKEPLQDAEYFTRRLIAQLQLHRDDLAASSIYKSPQEEFEALRKQGKLRGPFKPA